MIRLVGQRRLMFAFALIPLSGACEIRTQLGRSPADALNPSDVTAASDGSTGMDAVPRDLMIAEGGLPADGGGPTDSGVVADSGLDVPPLLACVPTAVPQVSPVPLRRLTNFEYNNTVRDLLADSTHPADALPFDGYPQDPFDFTATPFLIEGYHALAHDYAVKVTKDAASVNAITKCDVVAMGEAACQQKFIASFVPVALRRAPDPVDVTDFSAVFAKGRELGGNFASGVRAVVEVALQSPEFLYRVEFGQSVGAAQPLLARPTSYEMATRLSYLLWGSLPDATLTDAAAQDKLQTKEQIAAQARRMLTDPRAHDLVRYFYFGLLRINAPDVLSALVGAPSFSNFTADIPGLLLKETSAFIDEVTWQGPGDFQTLLTAPYSFVNAPLARFYGMTGVSGDAFQKVTLSATQRAGILTQASVLASTSHSSHSPTLRGKLVFEQILCGHLPPEPVVVSEAPPPIMVANTTRQRYQQHLFDPACAACHKDIDHVGFAFEHYDRVGLWRDKEDGFAIDATGEIYETDAKGKFNGAIELAQRLAQSRDAQSCYVRKWMTFGYGRQETPVDACSRESLENAFAQAKGNIRELLVALTQTDMFLYRPTK